MTKKELVNYLNEKGLKVTEADNMNDLWQLYNDLKPEKKPAEPVERAEPDQSKAAAKFLTDMNNEMKFIKISIIGIAVIMVAGFIIIIFKKN